MTESLQRTRLPTRVPRQVKYWRKYIDTEPGANRIFVNGTVSQTRLENMLPDAHYLIEVRAFNGAGLGPPGEHCEMFTKRPRKTTNDLLRCHAGRIPTSPPKHFPPF